MSWVIALNVLAFQVRRWLHRIGTFGPMPPREREPREFLATGKILPTDHQVADLEAHEDTFSFFGRSMSNPDWNTGVVQLACKCFHSTKNCSGVVFAGLLPSGHVKGKKRVNQL